MTPLHVAFNLLMAANDVGYGVGSGRIKGGWAYVWACYGITWAALALYGLSLWLRRPGKSENEAP